MGDTGQVGPIIDRIGQLAANFAEAPPAASDIEELAGLISRLPSESERQRYRERFAILLGGSNPELAASFAARLQSSFPPVPGPLADGIVYVQSPDTPGLYITKAQLAARLTRRVPAMIDGVVPPQAVTKPANENLYASYVRDVRARVARHAGVEEVFHGSARPRVTPIMESLGFREHFVLNAERVLSGAFYVREQDESLMLDPEAEPPKAYFAEPGRFWRVYASNFGMGLSEAEGIIGGFLGAYRGIPRAMQGSAGFRVMKSENRPLATLRFSEGYLGPDGVSLEQAMGQLDADFRELNPHLWVSRLRSLSTGRSFVLRVQPEAADRLTLTLAPESGPALTSREKRGLEWSFRREPQARSALEAHRITFRANGRAAATGFKGLPGPRIR